MGKKVKFTPIKRSQNTPLIKVLLKDPPVKRGAQRVNPNKIPNTAPRERT